MMRRTPGLFGLVILLALVQAAGTAPADPGSRYDRLAAALDVLDQTIGALYPFLGTEELNNCFGFAALHSGQFAEGVAGLPAGTLDAVAAAKLLKAAIAFDRAVGSTWSLCCSAYPADKARQEKARLKLKAVLWKTRAALVKAFGAAGVARTAIPVTDDLPVPPSGTWFPEFDGAYEILRWTVTNPLGTSRGVGCFVLRQHVVTQDPWKMLKGAVTGKEFAGTWRCPDKLVVPLSGTFLLTQPFLLSGTAGETQVEVWARRLYPRRVDSGTQVDLAIEPGYRTAVSITGPVLCDTSVCPPRPSGPLTLTICPDKSGLIFVEILDGSDETIQTFLYYNSSHVTPIQVVNPPSAGYDGTYDLDGWTQSPLDPDPVPGHDTITISGGKVVGKEPWLTGSVDAKGNFTGSLIPAYGADPVPLSGKLPSKAGTQTAIDGTNGTVTVHWNVTKRP